MDTCELLCAAAPLDLAVLAREVELNTVNRLAAAADLAAWTPPSRPIVRSTTPKRVLPRNRRLRRFSMSPMSNTTINLTTARPTLPFEEPLPTRRRSLVLPRASTFAAATSIGIKSYPQSAPTLQRTTTPLNTVRALDFSRIITQPSVELSIAPSSEFKRHNSQPEERRPNPFDNIQLKPLPRGATFTTGTRAPSSANWPPRKMLPLRKRISYPPKPPTPSASSPLDEWGDLVSSPFTTPTAKKQRRMVPLGSPCDVRAVQF